MIILNMAVSLICNLNTISSVLVLVIPLVNNNISLCSPVQCTLPPAAIILRNLNNTIPREHTPHYHPICPSNPRVHHPKTNGNDSETIHKKEKPYTVRNHEPGVMRCIIIYRETCVNIIFTTTRVFPSFSISDRIYKSRQAKKYFLEKRENFFILPGIGELVKALVE
jgi:hypothetical protein